MTDAEWNVLRPQVEQVMAQLRRGPGGRPPVHDPRAMLDAVRYVAKYGVEWRALPIDFPPWPAVYAFFERWSSRGLPQRLTDQLRGRLRVGLGRSELPTAASIDSQSVKAADTVGAATRGFDGGKKINGRKRHLVVDACGLLLVVLVTAAGVQDRDAGHRVLALLRERFSTITLVWADGGYAGRLVVWAQAVLRVTVTIVKRSDTTAGFVVLPRRWVSERTFGWLLRHRRLVRDYERLPEHHEAFANRLLAGAGCGRSPSSWFSVLRLRGWQLPRSESLGEPSKIRGRRRPRVRLRPSWSRRDGRRRPMERQDIDDELATPGAQELLASTSGAHLAYLAKDGTPRVIPVGFFWTGDEFVISTATTAPKVTALRARPDVALAIDAGDTPDQARALSIRGRASVEIVDGVVPEYLAAARKIMDAAAAAEFERNVRGMYDQMARIAITPYWVRYYEFGTGRMPRFLQELAGQSRS